MDLSKYLMSTRESLVLERELNLEFGVSYIPPAPRISCTDGFSLSVQAGRGLYCAPRTDRGPWHQVEVGFPSAVPELIMEHAEDPTRPTETVYGYVPIHLVEALIELHGGMVEPPAAA